MKSTLEKILNFVGTLDLLPTMQELGKMQLYDALCLLLVVLILIYFIVTEIRVVFLKRQQKRNLICQSYCEYDLSHYCSSATSAASSNQGSRQISKKFKTKKRENFVARFTRSGRMYGLHKLLR